MGIERQRQLLGGALGPASPVEQARWDQANIDYHKALAGDPYAYQSLQQNLAGVTPSDHDLAVFIRGGGAPVLALERQFQLTGGNVRPQEHLDRLERLNADLGAAAGGDAAALKRVEGALGMDRGALKPEMLAPGGSVLDTVKGLGVFATDGLVAGDTGLPGMGGRGIGTGSGSDTRPDVGPTSGTGGTDLSGGSRPGANDDLDSGMGTGFGPSSPASGGQGSPGETPGPAGGPGDAPGDGSTGSGPAASPWDDALAGLQASPATEPGFTEPRHSGPDASAPSSPTGPLTSSPAPTDPGADSGTSSTMSFEDESPTLVTGGTSEQRSDGTTRTTREDGSVVQTDATGNVIYDSRTGQGGTSEAGSDTNPGAGATDDDSSGGADDGSGDGSDGGSDDGSDDTDDDADEGATGTALTTGEDAPMSARTKSALGFLGVSDDTIDRPEAAGPDYGQGDPGASGDTGGGGGGSGDTGGGSSGDGSQPEPMTTGDSSPIIQDPGDRNPTAGPDFVRGDPGDAGDAVVGGGGGGGGTAGGAPGMDPTIAAGAGTDRAATASPAFADDFSASVMGGVAAPAEVSATHAAPALSGDIAAVAPDVAETAPAPVEVAPAPVEVAPAPVEVAQVETDVQDLPASHAAAVVAPEAFEAPEMEAPAPRARRPRPRARTAPR